MENMEIISRIYEHFRENPHKWQQRIDCFSDDTDTLYNTIDSFCDNDSELINLVSKKIKKAIVELEYPHTPNLLGTSIYHQKRIWTSIYYFNNHISTRIEHVLHVLERAKK